VIGAPTDASLYKALPRTRPRKRSANEALDEHGEPNAESSAVLAWLLDAESAPSIRRLLSDADSIVGSDLTLIKCDRSSTGPATSAN
jgi:hypothetical protein